MANVILVCGLNGAGKSTLGKALAARLGWSFVDIEDLYFPKNDPRYLYAQPRSFEEVDVLLQEMVGRDADFVLASVKGAFSPAVVSRFRCAVCLEAPKALRLRRVRDRSYQKFGARILPGGDLYEQEQRFFDLVEAREEALVDNWLARLTCPIIRAEGRAPVCDTAEQIVRMLEGSDDLTQGGCKCVYGK